MHISRWSVRTAQRTSRAVLELQRTVSFSKRFGFPATPEEAGADGDSLGTSPQVALGLLIPVLNLLLVRWPRV